MAGPPRARRRQAADAPNPSPVRRGGKRGERASEPVEPREPAPPAAPVPPVPPVPPEGTTEGKPKGGDSGIMAPSDGRLLELSEEQARRQLRTILEEPLPARTARWARDVVRGHMAPELLVRLHTIATGQARFPVPTMVGTVVYVPASAAVQVQAAKVLLGLGIPQQLGLADDAGNELPAALALPALVGLDGREAVPVSRRDDGTQVYDGAALLAVQPAEPAATPHAEAVEVEGVVPPASPPTSSTPPTFAPAPEIALEYVEVDEDAARDLGSAPDAHRVEDVHAATPINQAAVELVRRRLAARTKT